MTATQEQSIAKLCGARSAVRGECLQQLWSGYGEIVRYQLQGAEPSSVVVKQISLPEEVAHPRGWHSDTGHQRKLRSYAVEADWYRVYAQRCVADCKVAHCYGVRGAGVGCVMVLEDLDATGYAVRLQQASAPAVRAALQWLASFHAQWLGQSPTDLWPRGSYWHLATRPDEYAAMAEGALKVHAQALDKQLANAQYQTLIHGDAKIANFCFSEDHHSLAAVDFQYVGGGVGVVDLAYLLGSCLSGAELEQQGDELLDHYLHKLAEALSRQERLAPAQIAALLAEWRALYPVAWADFERFLQGWSPEHPKLNSYSARQTDIALARLTS